MSGAVVDSALRKPENGWGGKENLQEGHFLFKKLPADAPPDGQVGAKRGLENLRKSLTASE
jgi:hypothetical protein